MITEAYALVVEPTRGLEPLTTAFRLLTWRHCPMMLRTLASLGIRVGPVFDVPRHRSSFCVETYGLNHGSPRCAGVAPSATVDGYVSTAASPPDRPDSCRPRTVAVGCPGSSLLDRKATPQAPLTHAA
jgi:hypothetical protein